MSVCAGPCGAPYRLVVSRSMGGFGILVGSVVLLHCIVCSCLFDALPLDLAAPCCLSDTSPSH